MDAITNFLIQLSTSFGDQDPNSMMLLGCILFLVLVIIAYALRGSGNRRHEDQQNASIAVRVERLERGVNEFKKDFHDTLEHLRSITGDLQSEIRRLKGSIPGDDGSSGSGQSSGGEGQGPSGSTPGSGQSLSPLERIFETPVQAAPVEKPVSAIRRGLSKTRQSILGKVRQLFKSGASIDRSSLDELEEMLITADVGVQCTSRLIKKVEDSISSGQSVSEKGLQALVKGEIVTILSTGSHNERLLAPRRIGESPCVVMVVGVNGVGKTTTVAKLTKRWMEQGQKVLLVAADTFRAGAVDQLKVWGERLGAEVVSGAEDAKPATVVFDGMTRAKEISADIVIIDTAGRLHNKSNLMQELEGIRNIVKRHVDGAPHETLLVLDAVTGQNALNQAREFNSVTPLTGVVVTKLDGTPKGGIIIAIKEETGVPISFVGVGEKSEDLVPFDSGEFVESLFESDGEEQGTPAGFLASLGSTGLHDTV